MLEYVKNPLSFLGMICLLVVFHELGHFIVAKLCGVRVLRFSFGFGPKLLSVMYRGTEYTLCAVWLGGYVKMYGDTPNSQIADEDAHLAFNNKKIWQRTAIVLAGPTFNFLLATIVYFSMACGPKDFGDTRLGIVTLDEPAYRAGLRPGDRIVAVQDKPVADWDTLREAIARSPHAALRMTYERDGKSHDVTVTTDTRQEANAFAEQETRGKVGISLQYLRPRLGVVDAQSPASRAGLRTGDEVVKVNGVPVQAWHEMRALVMAQAPGSAISLDVSRDNKPLPTVRLEAAAPRPELSDGLFSAAEPAWGYFGLANENTIVAKVDADGATAQAGVEVGDRLLALHIHKADGNDQTRPIGVWEVDLATFGLAANSDLSVTLQRGADVVTRSFNLRERQEKDSMKNVRTTLVWGADNNHETLDTYTVHRTVGPIEAAATAMNMVYEDMSLISRGISKMLRGSLPASSVGGPIMLYVIAGKSAEQGLATFFHSLAMISVNIGLVNLLPIPVLDGGHLLFYVIELVGRRPPSVRTREVAHMMGLGLLLMLMVWAFRNDVLRFVLQ